MPLHHASQIWFIAGAEIEGKLKTSINCTITSDFRYCLLPFVLRRVLQSAKTFSLWCVLGNDYKGFQTIYFWYLSIPTSALSVCGSFHLKVNNHVFTCQTRDTTTPHLWSDAELKLHAAQLVFPTPTWKTLQSVSLPRVRNRLVKCTYTPAHHFTPGP